MIEGLDFVLILAGALVFDTTVGEPPYWAHPVVWMGKAISGWERLFSSRSHSVQFLYGTVITLVTLALFAVPVYYLLVWLDGISPVLYIIVAAVLFKMSFSIRELRRTAVSIRKLMLNDRLQQTRYEMRALVSRNTDDMPEVGLASAAVESVAESICDSIVAPVFYFMIMGVPGAIGYRVINTFDSMIGYHGRYEYLGKFAARVDDIVNYIPSRISVVLILAAAVLMRKNAGRSWKIALQEHGKTDSPNAGWTMAAVAGALNIRLEKMGSYVLCSTGNTPEANTISESVRLMMLVALLWVTLCIFAGVIYVYIAAGA